MFPRKLNKDDCDKWNKDKKRNPITGYSLKENSPKLKEIKRQCEIILAENIKETKPVSKPASYLNIHLPDSKSSSQSYLNIPLPDSKSSTSSKKDYNKKVDFELYYPDINDKKFTDKLLNIYDYNIHKIPKYKTINNIDDFNKVSNKMCSVFEKTYYQHFISQYINNRTPYKSILLYHGVGVGKTCSAITLAETFLS